jgi:hypothetical protein
MAATPVAPTTKRDRIPKGQYGPKANGHEAMNVFVIVYFFLEPSEHVIVSAPHLFSTQGAFPISPKNDSRFCYGFEAPFIFISSCGVANTNR